MQWSVVLIAFLGYANILAAQSDLLLYQFESVGQSLIINPALPQPSRIWVNGIGIGVKYANNRFSPKDLIGRDTDVNENLEKIVAGLHPNSGLQVDTRTTLLGAALARKSSRFTLALTHHTSTRLDLSDQLLGLAYYGNADDRFRSVELDDIDVEALAYFALRFAYQRQLEDDYWTVGASLNVLKGQAHGYIAQSDAHLVTTPLAAIEADADVLLRTAGVGDLLGGKGASPQVFPQGNWGVAADMGIHYSENGDFAVSASLLDLGLIRWSSSAYAYSFVGAENYDGLTLDLATDTFAINAEDEVVDSLEAAFKFNELGAQAYTKTLSPRLLVGGEYKLSERSAAQVNYQARYWGRRLYQSIGVGYVYRLDNYVQAILSYTRAARAGALGMGFSARGGPVQFYLLAENVPHLIAYENARHLTLSTGLNVTIIGSRTRYLKRKLKTNIQRRRR